MENTNEPRDHRHEGHEKSRTAIRRLVRNPWIISGAIIIILIVAIIAVSYLEKESRQVYTDQAEISAPEVDLSPTVQGTLEQMFVNPGDQVNADTVVARVGNQLIKTTSAGIIVTTDDEIGKTFDSGETVAAMIDPTELRVVASVDENKGLSDIKVGDQAQFTVDAFGSKKFDGVVDEISPTSNEGDVVFNISDKREEKQFDVKIRFDTVEYPQLKNGMSARVWIYKD